MNTIPAPQPRASRFWQFAAALSTLLSPARAGLMVFVGIPTFVTLIYYGLIASDIYISESAFTVRLEKGQQLDAGMLMPSMFSSNGQQDQMMVNSYIHSRGGVESLLKTIDLRAIYRSPKADMFAHLKKDATQEELVDYYKSMIHIMYDDRAMVSTLQVRAFTAEEAQQLNNAILEQAEIFVNALSQQIRHDSVDFAKAQVRTAEEEMLAANKAVTDFRKTNRNFDPASTSQGAAELVQQLEGKLAEKRAERDTVQGVMTAQNPRMKALNREIAALERQVDKQVNGLTTTKPGALSRQLEDYASVALKQEFAGKRYALALGSLEAAQATAGRKSIYLTRVVQPSLPEEAREPRRLHRIFSVFFLSLASYGMLLLIAASIRDHIRE